MGKKCILLVFFTILFLAFSVSSASAAAIDLYDWAFNVDGTTYEYFLGDSMPTSGALDGQGLGTLTWSTSVAGAHNFIAFFDHEIDETINTFFNEYGATSGAPVAGQSWEIDEPGFINGDIYENLLNNILDNGIGTSIYGDTTFPDDVSWAMGWDFNLAAGETATISLILGSSAPGSGFYLSQTDPESEAPNTIYFSSSLEVVPTSVPDASILLLLSSALGYFGALEIKKLLNKTT